jgi:hypothetical protein
MYKDENIEREYLSLHQSKTVIFGKIILMMIFVVNMIDVIFKVTRHINGTHPY